MRFVAWDEVVERLRGKRVAVVGSGPSVLENTPGYIDSHDVVVRVNNYKTGEAQGYRCDVHYSFYGSSIRKTRDELRADGVELCLCKCPDGAPIRSLWHKVNGRQNGVDFRYIYQNRRTWWFCDTFIPSPAHFIRSFELLQRHIPTTGFAAILDVLACKPALTTLTGFDFFVSGLHNVDEPWRPGNPEDPIGHRPDFEAQWLADHAHDHLLALDETLSRMLNERRKVAA